MHSELFDFFKKDKRLFTIILSIVAIVEVAILLSFVFFYSGSEFTAITNSKGETIFKNKGHLEGANLRKKLIDLNIQSVSANPLTVHYEDRKGMTTIENASGEQVYQTESKKTGKNLRTIIDNLVREGLIEKKQSFFEKNGDNKRYNVIYSPPSYRTVIKDMEGKIVYDEGMHLRGRGLTDVKNMLAFQFLEDNFDIQYLTENASFPVRSWIAFSINFPLGIILFFSFIINMFYSKKEKDEKNIDGEVHFSSSINSERIMGALNSLNRFNINSIGVFVFLAVFLYWAIPDLFLFFGEKGYEIWLDEKWAFLGLTAILVLWLFWRADRRDKYSLEKMKCLKEIQIEANREKVKLQIHVQEKERTLLKLDEKLPTFPSQID